MHGIRLALATAFVSLPFLAPAHAAEVFARDFSRFNLNSCPQSNGCQVSLGTVPANQVYEIKMVSCYAGQDNVNGSILYWYFTAVKQPAQYGQIHLRPTKLGFSSPTLTWNATESGIVRALAGANLSVTLQGATAGAISHLHCTIGGSIYNVQ